MRAVLPSFRVRALLVAAASIAVITGAVPPRHAAADPSYGIAVMRDVMIPMRDGVKLATDIYRPAQPNGLPLDGKFPAVMERTPYNKDSIATTANYFAPRGYVVVAQDVRARYKSEGHWRPIADDPNDGADTAKWLGAQPWFDGNLGTVGTSYGGATQHALAIANPPYLKTMIPIDAMSNFGRYGVRHNGAFELRFFNWVLTMGNAVGANAPLASARAASSPAAADALADLGLHVRDYVLSLPLRPGTTPLKFAPDYEAWLVEAMKHGDYDDFWKNHGSSVIDHLAEYKDIPIQHVTGWYDS